MTPTQYNALVTLITNLSQGLDEITTPEGATKRAVCSFGLLLAKLHREGDVADVCQDLETLAAEAKGLSRLIREMIK